MSDLLLQLERYGADVEGTMARLAGNEALLERCLRILVAEDGFDRLCDAVSAGDAGEAFRVSHALKGAAANLGLLPLYEPVSALNEGCRGGALPADAAALCAAVLDRRAALAKALA